MYNKYQIKDGELFKPDNCPMVKNEVIALQQSLAEFSPANKVNIVLSYLKNHSINSVWLKTNPELVYKLSSGGLAVSHIEAYFDECKGNVVFLEDFENFIKMELEREHE